MEIVELIEKLEKAFKKLGMDYNDNTFYKESFFIQLPKQKKFIKEIEELDLTVFEEIDFELDNKPFIDKATKIFGAYFLFSLKSKRIKEKRLNSRNISSEEVLWQNVPIGVIREHFGVFTYTLNKDGSPFLNETQLNEFIELVFVRNSKLERKININYSKSEKGFVIKRFWEFYKKCFSFNEINKMDMYIDILLDNFLDMEYGKVKTFFNGNKCKRVWKECLTAA